MCALHLHSDANKSHRAAPPDSPALRVPAAAASRLRRFLFLVLWWEAVLLQLLVVQPDSLCEAGVREFIAMNENKSPNTILCKEPANFEPDPMYHVLEGFAH